MGLYSRSELEDSVIKRVMEISETPIQEREVRHTLKELLERIASDTRSSKAQWKFISYHIPSLNFSGYWSNWGSPEVFRVFADAGVDFVITGHSHQYERFRPVAPPRLLVADKRGGSFVTYITSAGGGAPLYKVKPTVYHAKAKKCTTSVGFISRLTNLL